MISLRKEMPSLLQNCFINFQHFPTFTVSTKKLWMVAQLLYVPGEVQQPRQINTTSCKHEGEAILTPLHNGNTTWCRWLTDGEHEGNNLTSGSFSKVHLWCKMIKSRHSRNIPIFSCIMSAYQSKCVSNNADKSRRVLNSPSRQLYKSKVVANISIKLIFWHVLAHWLHQNCIHLMPPADAIRNDTEEM